MTCGELLKIYDAIAVFEDDVYASPAFYGYMKQSVEYYQDDPNIAGISLYTHLWNVNTGYNFTPAPNGYDVFFMQFAQSWGQIWLKKQWQFFQIWYEENNEEFESQNNVPSFVTSWPKSSWLKYHIKYCIEKNKYFVYPYQGYSTCFSEIGEHSSVKGSHLQIPLVENYQDRYKFIDLKNKNAVVYDAFFERMGLGVYLGVDEDELCVDLNGSKLDIDSKKFLLSMKEYNYEVIRKFALELRPQESNIINNINGDSIFLYNTREISKHHSNTISEASKFRYYNRLYGKTSLSIRIIIENILEKIRILLKM